MSRRLTTCPLALLRRTAVALAESRRHVAGTMGRGDLYFKNHENTSNRTRTLGIQRGLVHNSQATEPMTGQLQYRKRVLHASTRGGTAASAAARAPIATWSHLVPSITTGVRAAIPPPVFAKLLGGEALTAAEADRLAEGQRLFRYELHQRLPLLEDSFADASVRELVDWAGCFKRAWVLPPTGEAAQISPAVETPPSSSILPAVVCCVPPVPFGSISATSDSSGLAVAAKAADMTPTANQIFDLDERLLVLSQQVRLFAEQELMEAQQGMNGGSSQHERWRAREQKLHDKWAEACEWFGWESQLTAPAAAAVH